MPGSYTDVSESRDGGVRRINILAGFGPQWVYTLNVSLDVSGTEGNDHDMGVFGDDGDQPFEDDVAKGKRRRTVRLTRVTGHFEGADDGGEEA